MRMPVRYEARNPIDQRWPLEDECQCWDFRPLEMTMKHICADFNLDGMLVMRNPAHLDGVVEEDVWCSTCTHTPRCHEGPNSATTAATRSDAGRLGARCPRRRWRKRLQREMRRAPPSHTTSASRTRGSRP